MAKKTRKPTSGGGRMRAAGKKPMLLGWLPEQLEGVRQAAAAEGIYPTQYVMRAALREAEEFLRKRTSPP